ncbi:MAG: PAS domain S-box protein [Gemmatimonadetes bacterium]|nr:PAS domain S-box protein [Gemmatimonadota bacterium]
MTWAAAVTIPVAAALIMPPGQPALVAISWLCLLVPVCITAYRKGWPGLASAAGIAFLLIGSTTIGAMAAGRPTDSIVLTAMILPPSMLIAGVAAVRLGLRRRMRGLIHALVDPLTGLPNRRHAELFLEREFAVAELGRPFAIAILDVDGFARYNEANGEAAANGVLRTIATILRQNTRSMNISARYVDDQFICLLSGANDEGAFIFAQRIQDRLNEAGSVATLPTVSIAVGCYAPHMDSPRDLLRAVEGALHDAKRDGGDRLRVAGWSREDLERTATTLAGAAPRPTAPPPPVHKPMPTIGRNAFVLTGDAQLRRHVSIELERDGFRVTEGTSALDGIRPLNADFDVVVLDLGSSEGVPDLIREIRLRYPATRIVGLTRLEGESVTASILTARVDGHYLQRDGHWTFEPGLPELLRERDRLREASLRTRQLSDEARAREREAKRVVEETEARLRSVEQAIQEVVFRTDVAGAFSSLNPAWHSITRHRVEDALDRPIIEFFHEADRALLREDFQTLIAMARPYVHREARVLVRTGGIRWVEVRAQVALDRLGRPLGATGTLIDVTDRKTAEEALRHSEEYFRALIENSADLIAVFDEKGRIRYASPAVERVLGYGTDERAGAPVFEMIHPDDLPAVYTALRRLTELDGATTSFEVRIRHRDGDWRYFAISVRNMMSHRAVGGFVANAHDVTPKRAAEQALRESQEELFRARKMDAIGVLAGGVAHDFNNLLTSIQGHAELILKERDVDEPVRQDLSQIQDAAARAASLTRQLLAFSRRLVLQPRVFDLNVLVTDMQKMLVRMAGDTVRLHTELAASRARVKADPTQIEQVILNLAINAREAMPSGGVLAVRTGHIELSAGDAVRELPAGRYITLSVSDTGSGIPAALRDQIFDPFFSTKDQARTAGLGLSTVYGIVKQSGGHIVVESRTAEDVAAGTTPDRAGTRFTLYLPEAAEAVERVGEPPLIVDANGGSETIALVEDEKTVLDLATRILRRKGYNVLPAENGRLALDVIARYPDRIDMLVTDVVMPGMNGRDLADRINVMRPGVRVLFMSGYSAEAVAQHGVLAEGASFLEKPFSPDGLLRKVREMLDDAAPQPN